MRERQPFPAVGSNDSPQVRGRWTGRCLPPWQSGRAPAAEAPQLNAAEAQHLWSGSGDSGGCRLLTPGLHYNEWLKLGFRWSYFHSYLFSSLFCELVPSYTRLDFSSTLHLQFSLWHFQVDFFLKQSVPRHPKSWVIWKLWRFYFTARVKAQLLASVLCVSVLCLQTGYGFFLYDLIWGLSSLMGCGFYLSPIS